MTRHMITPGLILSLFMASAATASADDVQQGLELFKTKIRPVLEQRCYDCHSMEAEESKGGLTLDTRAGIRQGGESGPAVVPHDVKASQIIPALRHETFEMPPEEELSESVVADFVKWIELGAPDPREGEATETVEGIDLEAGRKFWAFQPPQMPPVPNVADVDWPVTDIDRFILARLEDAQLAPVEDAGRRVLIRRATYDLIGLPPTPEEVEAFVADESPRAFEKVIDRLLDSPRFGERWGRHWLDVARFAESTGMERNIPFAQAWRYRDWVVRALNDDMPYDRFLMQQIAGDLLPADNAEQQAEQLIATGFLAVGPKGVNERDAEKYLMDVVDDQIDVTGRAVLGLTIACARCHDHKFDPIPQSDYYALAGIFRSTETLSGVSRGAQTNDAGELMPLPTVDEKAFERFEQHRKQLTGLRNEYNKADRKLRQLRAKAARSAKGKAAEKSAADAEALQTMQQEVRRLQKEMRELEKQAPPAPPMTMAVRDRARPVDQKLCVRGDVRNLGDVVPRGFLTVATTGSPTIQNAAQSGRLELAHWLAGPENPLTARVMVNRIWHHLFGAGLVATVDNFGSLGEQPSHPQLLDYLALRFMQDGWSVKRTIREIMLSRAYQLASTHDAHNYEVDPDNRLLWRMSRRRLDAEVIRDAMLSVSGQLDPAPPQGSQVAALGSGEVGRNARARFDSDAHRSIYLPVVRGLEIDALKVFDMADPSLVVGSRDTTTVATQALYMMNSPLVIEQSEHFARRLLGREDLDDGQRLDLAYELALSRDATPQEQSQALDFLREFRQLSGGEAKAAEADLQAWTALCQTLLASAEFRYTY